MIFVSTKTNLTFYICVRIAGTGCKLGIKHYIFGLYVLILWISCSVLVTEGGRILCPNLLDDNKGYLDFSIKLYTVVIYYNMCEIFFIPFAKESNNHLRKHCIGCKIDQKFEEASEFFWLPK